MRKLIFAAALLAFAFAPAVWAKVSIDYAKEMDFGGVKTFQLKPNDETAAKDQLLDDSIVQKVKAKLKAAGLTEATANPDIYVTYHVVTKDTPVLNTSYGGFGPGWGAWGGLDAATTVSTYTEDTLVVDAYRPSDNKLVWRGQGTTSWSDKPEKRDKQIQDTLDDLSARWQKILHNQGE